MTDDNYLKAIGDAQRLLTELLNDPEHGKLTFKGAHGLDDLVITGPSALNAPTSGAALMIDGDEWMALGSNAFGPRQWQHFAGGCRATNEELYLLALKNADDLYYIHDGYRPSADL